ncbi:MAG: ABC transporter ATP-binding protein [Natrialbaceae archaeon]|nr:ABC transporter ATP-binding protein [Natrialbaceae archaeon]
MIEFRSVTFAYESDAVIERLSFTIPDGSVVLLAGANGSGKTTILRHCNGLLSPDEGEVLVDGVSVEDDLVGARTAVGMVFQNPRDQFVAATVEDDVSFGPENLGLSHETIEERVSESIEAVGLEEKRTARIDTLSGGEQARLAIAGALAMRPSHLVLDEPFAGVDERARQAIQRHLESLIADGTGVIIASHDLRDLLGMADRIIGLERGHIAFDQMPEGIQQDLEAIGVRPPPS